MIAFRRCSLFLALATTVEVASAAGPLTVGSPAPPLKLSAFLKGEPVKEMSRGSVYAIEFSGTQCAPCIRAMPQLTELQKKHPLVTFISVYSENPEVVRAHIARHDAEIGYRVALDDNYAMIETWLEASLIRGIPAVFLVGKDSTIAWIGMPDDLDTSLAKLSAGAIDPRLERMRLSFKQAEAAAEVEWRKRRDRSDEAYNRTLALAKDGKWAEAIQAAEQSARDFPDDAFSFHLAKLYVLASNPQALDRAINFAAELSAMVTYSRLGDLGKGRSGTFDAQIAQSLLDGGSKAGDPILTEAATILLGRAEAGLVYLKDEEERFARQKYISQILAKVDARKNDFAMAAKRLRQTLDMIRQRQCPETSAEAREAWEKNRRDQVAEVEEQLSEYVQAAEKGRRGP